MAGVVMIVLCGLEVVFVLAFFRRKYFLQECLAKRADSILNHTLKNTMADAAGWVDLFVDAYEVCAWENLLHACCNIAKSLSMMATTKLFRMHACAPHVVGNDTMYASLQGMCIETCHPPLTPSQTRLNTKLQEKPPFS